LEPNASSSPNSIPMNAHNNSDKHKILNARHDLFTNSIPRSTLKVISLHKGAKKISDDQSIGGLFIYASRIGIGNLLNTGSDSGFAKFSLTNNQSNELQGLGQFSLVSAMSSKTE
ncbi:hypothetical protein Ciccas_010934, partial [Cichlidogyrus casuarinus]